MRKKRLILIGGGGHCRSCIDVIEQEAKYEIAGIVDMPEKIGSKVLGYPIIGSDNDMHDIAKNYANFFITIGHLTDVSNRIKVFNILRGLKVNLPIIISPLAYISSHALVDSGSIIMHHSIVNSGASVGKNTIINSKALIEHDAIIGNHCHISTGAIINGGVEVGDMTFYGSGAVSKQNTKIPERSFIKANSLVK